MARARLERMSGIENFLFDSCVGLGKVDFGPKSGSKTSAQP